MKRLFLKLSLILFLVGTVSCESMYEVMEYYPLQEYSFNSEAQLFSIDVEDIVNRIAINYWEGAADEDWDLVQNAGNVPNPNIKDDLLVDGGWFIAQATHEPLKLEVKIEKNESESPRHIEIYVDMVNRNGAGKITTKAGHGYHILLHQAAKE